MNSGGAPTSTTDALNARILAVSEDKLHGFHTDPIREIARLSGVGIPLVIERIRAMRRAGTIRRVRRTLMSTNLVMGVAHGTDRDVVLAHKRAIDEHSSPSESPRAAPTYSGVVEAGSNRAKSRRSPISRGARRKAFRRFDAIRPADATIVRADECAPRKNRHGRAPDGQVP